MNDKAAIAGIWDVEQNAWMLWLVHLESGDRCDMETQDPAPFVQAHGGT